MRVHTLGLKLDWPRNRNDPYDGESDSGDEYYYEELGAECATKTLQKFVSCRSDTAPPLRFLCLRGWLKRDATLNALLPCMQDLRVSQLKQRPRHTCP